MFLQGGIDNEWNSTARANKTWNANNVSKLQAQVCPSLVLEAVTYS